MRVQGRGQRHAIALRQGVHPRSKTGGHRIADIHPYGFIASVVTGEGSQAVGASLQVPATGRQRVAGRMAVACGGGPGNRGRLWPAAGAHGKLACRLQRRHVGNALQLALFKKQAAAVNHHQHEQQGKAQGNHRH